MSFTQILIERTKELSRQIDELSFTFDGYIYNPLDYAWPMHKAFLERYVHKDAPVFFLGMNPGPFGMMQTGVPFGEVNAVRDYLKLDEEVSKPQNEHPNRPVLGMACTRSEVSGRRLWGLFSDRYSSADEFSLSNSVFNYCPLGFLMNTKTAKNFTPDHLPKEERMRLDQVCDSYLVDVIELIKPKALIGVGKYAQSKLESADQILNAKQNFTEKRIVDSIIHPSPGNPQANNGWAEKTKAKLEALGIWS